MGSIAATTITSQEKDLKAEVARCLEGAADYAYSQMEDDGHWCLEVRSSISFTVQWLCIRQILGPPLTAEEAASYQRWLLSQQHEDGSWSLAPPTHKWPGDVSCTAEAYFGLKLLGMSTECDAMRNARAFVLRSGGITHVSVLTQLVFALFGIISWDDMAQVPAELMALPPGFSPINIYSFSYWSRVSAIAVMVLRHHRPVYPLRPFGRSSANATSTNYDEEAIGSSFLDELFLNPIDRKLKSTPTLSVCWQARDIGRLCCTAVDKAASVIEPMLRRTPVRSYCVSQCIRYIIDHLDEGGFGSLTISNFLGVSALHASGFQNSHPIVQHIQRSMEVSLFEDCAGLRMQVTTGPVWDTALFALGLLESSKADKRIDSSIKWIKDHQILDTHGDYRLTNPSAVLPGGWSFQYSNTYFPDNDDTLVCILALVMRSPKDMASPSVVRALDWLLAMQNSDGGWGTYDKDGYNYVANLFPFADGVEFYDDSVPDVTGRVLEVLGFIAKHPLSSKLLRPVLRQRIVDACRRSFPYLARTQDKVAGTWSSRWHVNYLNGTSSVLCALPYFDEQDYGKAGVMVYEGLSWIKAVQNSDGGWGESLDSYREIDFAGRGLVSTPTQTAWAVMALLAFLPPSDTAIVRGIRHLLATQSAGEMEQGITWIQEEYVSVGFPNTLWLDFGCMRHGYPMIALGRYLHACRELGEKEMPVSF